MSSKIIRGAHVACHMDVDLFSFFSSPISSVLCFYWCRKKKKKREGNEQGKKKKIRDWNVYVVCHFNVHVTCHVRGRGNLEPSAGLLPHCHDHVWALSSARVSIRVGIHRTSIRPPLTRQRRRHARSLSATES